MCGCIVPLFLSHFVASLSLFKMPLYCIFYWCVPISFSCHLFRSAPQASAELEPRTETHQQVSEEDMGLTFEELGVFGRLRKIARCGPVAMFERARHIWSTLPVAVVADKVLCCASDLISFRARARSVEFFALLL